MYACLGYKRKEIYILREVLGCLMDLVVCGREEDDINRVTPQTTGLGIRNGSGTIESLTLSSNRGGVGSRLNESSSGNESVLKLLKYVCRVLGIDLDAVKLVGGFEKSATDQDAGQSQITSIYDDGLRYEQYEVYGWPELQVGVVREAVAIAEALPGKAEVYHISFVLTFIS